MARRIKVFSIITLLISSFILGEIIPQTSQPDSMLQKAKTLFQSVDNIFITWMECLMGLFNNKIFFPMTAYLAGL